MVTMLMMMMMIKTPLVLKMLHPVFFLCCLIGCLDCEVGGAFTSVQAQRCFPDRGATRLDGGIGEGTQQSPFSFPCFFFFSLTNCAHAVCDY